MAVRLNEDKEMVASIKEGLKINQILADIASKEENK